MFLKDLISDGLEFHFTTRVPFLQGTGGYSHMQGALWKEMFMDGNSRQRGNKFVSTYTKHTPADTIIFRVQTMCLCIELPYAHQQMVVAQEPCSMRSLVEWVILLVHSQGTRLSWKKKNTGENSWQHCSWPVTRHDWWMMKKKASKGWIFLLKRKWGDISHTQHGLGGLKKGLHPAHRWSSISPPSTEGFGSNILKIFCLWFQGSQPTLSYWDCYLPFSHISGEWDFTTYDMFLVNGGSFWSNRSLPA